jgi:hypothetical protein
MTDRIFNDLMAIAAGVVGLAIVAVIVSNQAKTSNIISSAGTAFSGILKEAVSPVLASGGLPSIPSIPSGG